MKLSGEPPKTILLNKLLHEQRQAITSLPFDIRKANIIISSGILKEQKKEYIHFLSTLRFSPVKFLEEAAGSEFVLLALDVAGCLLMNLGRVMVTSVYSPSSERMSIVPAMVLHDDVVADGKAHTGAFTGRFCGQERREYAGQDI